MKAIVALICCAVAVAAIDPALDAQCQDWIIKNQKDLIILNQVALSSRISSCKQFCMMTSAGLRADTTTCNSLCQRAGGMAGFSKALSMKDGAASPFDICNSLFVENAAPASLQEAVSFVQVSDAAKQRKLGVRGDMTIQGTLVTSVLTSPIGDVKVSGEVNVMNAVEANSLQTAFLKADAGTTIKDKIISKRDQLIIKGRIDADSISADSLSASFLEIDGVKQWALHSLEDFEEVGVDGWSHGEITECGGHRLLGGHCVQNGNEVTKTFSNLPPHSQIRVVAKYMFIDSWDGETGYLKLDDRPVWLESYNYNQGDAKHGINICGNEAPERRFGRSVDVTIPHKTSQVTLTFGATTDEHSCDESFGIDSVMIFVR